MKNDDFEQQVRQQVERLMTCSCQSIEREVAEKRIEWWKQSTGKREHYSPREAFETLFFEYLKLCVEELPVIAESDSEIVWLSKNRCQTLEACNAIGLNTQHVCRAVYEKSTQALLSQMDPELRFLRSYTEIRPHASHCKEMIVRIDFEGMMRLAIEEAIVSRHEGNKGYGAVVAMGNRIIGKAHDTAATEKDPSLHAEVNAIRQAVRALDDTNLSGAILFSSCEPCPMCSSLAVWANMTTIVFGASIQETAELGKARILVGSNEIVEKSPVMIDVIGGVLGDECLALYA